MKKLSLKYLVLLLFSFALVTSCSDDNNDPEVSPFVGDYVISNAEVSEAFALKTVEGVDLPVAVGTDITDAIQSSLLSAVTCSSPDKSYIELKEDKTMYLSCEGADPLNAGTWEELSDTSIKLNMNNAAIPSSPAGFVLTVTDIVLVGNQLSGTTSVPMPREMFAAGAEAFGFTLADEPTVYPVTFSLDLTKK
jgi:hypothetical protein